MTGPHCGLDNVQTGAKHKTMPFRCRAKTCAKRFSAKTGAVYPEFMITIDNSDQLIVVECKADVKKHRSNTLKEYKDYAADGALLYSSYLSKEFDVIAIGVSGENEQESET